MKLWSKEALLLGGIYGVSDAPFSLFGFDNISDILFLLFFLCVIMLCFNKTPKFISYFLNKYPKISYYLISTGWIPFFMITVYFAILVSSIYIGDDSTIFSFSIFGLSVISLLAFMISLTVAFIRDRKNHKIKK